MTASKWNEFAPLISKRVCSGLWEHISFPVGSKSTDGVGPLLVLQWNGEKRSRAPVQQINYLKYISIAKYGITWNTTWMLVQICRLLRRVFFSCLRAVVFNPSRNLCLKIVAVADCNSLSCRSVFCFSSTRQTVGLALRSCLAANCKTIKILNMLLAPTPIGSTSWTIRLMVFTAAFNMAVAHAFSEGCFNNLFFSIIRS